MSDPDDPINDFDDEAADWWQQQDNEMQRYEQEMKDGDYSE